MVNRFMIEMGSKDLLLQINDLHHLRMVDVKPSRLRVPTIRQQYSCWADSMVA